MLYNINPVLFGLSSQSLINCLPPGAWGEGHYMKRLGETVKKAQLVKELCKWAKGWMLVTVCV